MKHAGYDTWLFGFHHESINGSSDPEKLGYNHIRKSINHTASKVTNSFIDFLTEQKANNNDMPFYASVGFEETHLPVDHFEPDPIDRKSTRLNSSHVAISYAVFCLKK